MMSWCQVRFFLFALPFFFFVLAHAIYDPREATTKPPKRRELLVPWHSADKVDSGVDLSRSPKWQVDPDNPNPKKPYVVEVGTKTWTPWKKNPGSEIEQRTEVEDQGQTNLDQQDDFSLEYSQFEQQSNRRFPQEPSGFSDQEGKRKDGGPKRKGPGENSLPIEPKDDQDLYEGVPADSQKPRKEKILVSTKPKSTVARYDTRMGVQCPEFDSTGQFVYPPDCKFFVNCWKGRAFVQPCAPGTLFNPDTLECDFPHKVKCYGGEVADFPSNEHLDFSGKREPLAFDGYLDHGQVVKLRNPKCPPHVTGLLAHPSECTKFLQCANGGTYIMDCGPGTVFNPAISVCDWPNNVRGCEDALKSEEEATTPLVHPDSEYYDHILPSEHRATSIVKCPSDFTGLLPHPDTCTKFLQCANGGTFVMDCGPGTAFNPSISVCDWPYNVPSCKKDKQKQHPVGTSTTVRPWSTHSSSGSWQHNHPHRRPGYPSTYPSSHPTTTPPSETDWSLSRPTWKPNLIPHGYTTAKPPGSDWDSSRPTWTPTRRPVTWTVTVSPPYTQTDYQNGDEQNRYNGYDQWSQTQSSVYPQSQWQPQTGEEKPNSNSGYHHHYHQHTYSHGQTYSPDRNTETQQFTPPFAGQSSSQKPDQNVPQTGNWDSNHGQHHYHYHHHHHGTPDEQHSVSNNGWNPEEIDPQIEQQSSRDHDYVPSNRRIDQASNRQDHGRISPDFSRPETSHSPSSDRRIYVNKDYRVPGHSDSVHSWNKTTWTPILSSENRSVDHSWSQQGLSQTSTQNRPWDQDNPNVDVRIQNSGSKFNNSRKTNDKEVDTRLDLLGTNTNVFLQNKPPHRPGIKNGSPNSSSSGIHVNVNGTRGHFITKEIEVNQGHSKTMTYRPNDIQSSNKFNNNDQNIYVDSAATNIDRMPPLVLQPPLYKPNNNGFALNNFSQGQNHSSIGRGHRTLKQYWPNNPSSMDPDDLTESGSNYHRAAVPSTSFQPPYPPVDRPSISTFLLNLSANSYYPPIPSTNMQPPPHGNPSFPIGWQYPPIPAAELQPPFFEPPPRTMDHRNNPNVYLRPTFHPSDRFPSSNFTSNATLRNVNVTVEKFPPFHPETSDNSRGTFDKVKNRTERVPGKEPTFPPKKRVMEITEKPEIETIKPNVPKDLTEEENATEYPDILEPDFDKDVDVLVEKEIWKPVLVFENRTQTTTTTESSVIMKINKKKVDVDLFNIEAAPFEKEEPPFPAYYIPSVAPLDHSKKATLPTPISGQIIRLRGGSGPHDGYVEVQGMNPGWGIVCDSRNSWTLKEANVICRQLGYSRGAEMAWQGRNNRNGMPNWIAANFVSCQGDEARFQSCKFKHEQVCRAERDAIGVRCVANRVAHCHKDEVPFEGQCYHLADPESGFNHAEALEYCAERNARLVDITSQDENDFISEWIIQKHSDVASIMTSGVGFTTLNRTLWLWEDSARAKFRFTKWWPGWMEDKKHPPFVGSRPLCLIMKRKFPCHERPDSICVADYFFWDTEDCAASGKGHSYICKRPYDDIGCIYGKGSQYGGTANVTASGKDCLSWGDPRIAHPLMMNVLNRDVREKLKSHNYCRNPNPNRENRPWCFTGPGGQRENCDIPPCGNIGKPKSLLAGKCKPKHFECLPGECIPSPWVCDGEEDCTNGADEKACTSHMDLFKKHSKYKLEGYDVQKWLNTPLKTCALRCKEADFTCRSFAHKAAGNICLLSDSNIGLSGSLKPNKEYDYYEMKERSVNCEGMFLCNNQKCVNQTQVCNGKNDCNDRSDENICTVENLDYDIRLADAENKHEGRIEVKILGIWGQVCDDGFGMIDADVICKELGFSLGGLEVRPGGFYGNMDPPTRFMVDQLRCRGNETSLRECDFEGWGVHNCQPEEAVGVVCKTAVDSCQDGHWKCDKSPMCIPTAFICDEVVDCPDGSDESSEHCDAPFEIRLANGSSPLEGRVEVRHHGIWGTVCDDDFSNATAAVICRSLGYGGRAIAKKDGYFGPGEGPIWLDEVFCYGNETQLYRCDHNHWGQHNCNHDEDAGVICTSGDVSDSKLYWENAENIPELNINDILPSNCGRRYTGFNEDEDFILEKVVRGTIAPKGSYPWQASIRVRGHSRSNHWCGAVILSSLHVLTAAHCLQGYNKGTYFVRAGDYNTEIDEESEAEANIEDYYIHEDFRKGHRMNNDIAVVLLKGRGIPLGKDIVPICLPPENAEYPPGLNCTISGFGSIETGKSTHSKDLRYGWIPLLDQSVCRAGHVYGEGAISDGMVCAGHLDEGIDTCDGDSGGPLACINNGAFTLYGITSWGQHCGRANKPGVYVRVSHYRQWIDKKIKESLSGR